jgi:transcriptional regulator with PAS, ATPase and Fis domain
MSDTVTRARRPPTVVRYAKTRVTVSRGPDTGANATLAGSSVRVGTASENELVLRDDTVSRQHCELEAVPTGVRVFDRGSTNGVHLGGVRLYDAIVPVDARLRLGDTELTLTPLGETVDKIQASTDRFGDLLGCSPRMRELFAELERIAPTDATVLLEGETGTGKDVAAESLHQESSRAEGPFVVFDCGAVAPTLIESELFGHERGAFTGAVQARAGVFEQAHQGTLFLDEIGELPKDLQPKLLRALERREIRRVGGSRTVEVDVRVIAATNRSLRHEVHKNNFRPDLYYRLSTALVQMPPLRERMEDLPQLVAHFLAMERPPRSIDDVSPLAWEMLRAHRWPGNVRELRNAVQRLSFRPNRPIEDTVSGLAVRGPAAGGLVGPGGEIQPLRLARRDASDAFERAYLTGVLASTTGNVTRAAAKAEVSRQMMQKLMKKHGIGESRS